MQRYYTLAGLQIYPLWPSLQCGSPAETAWKSYIGILVILAIIYRDLGEGAAEALWGWGWGGVGKRRFRDTPCGINVGRQQAGKLRS